MSLSYKRRKKALLQAKMVDGEAHLRLMMKRKPEQYPRWIFGVKAGGRLIQKAFPAAGNYTAKGHGKTITVCLKSSFPCISTIAYYRSQLGG